MSAPKLVGPALALLCLPWLSAPALAGPYRDGPQVIPGVGPEAPPPSGRYGGGLIEFLMTGRSSGPAAAPEPSADPARAVAYAGPPGYEMPRRPVDPAFVRQEVAYPGPQAPGTIVIDTDAKFLYLVQDGGQALRYGIGVGRPGFLWRGEKAISRKAEWPDWTPPAEMVKRRPDLPSHMEGGIANPLGARALYLGSSLYRIHGTNEPDTIGTNVSSGCIRLTNDDVTDLFGRVRVGTRVIVM